MFKREMNSDGIHLACIVSDSAEHPFPCATAAATNVPFALKLMVHTLLHGTEAANDQSIRRMKTRSCRLIATLFSRDVRNTNGICGARRYALQCHHEDQA